VDKVTYREATRAPTTWQVRRSQDMNGKTASLRRTFRLAPGYQLQRDPSGSGHTLVSPKGPIQLNESAAMILDLCNGTCSGEEIVARVLRAKDNNLADDVRAFLDAAQRRGWIVES
jgi:pyrroloquinoline quinone biosynthesis protein D